MDTYKELFKFPGGLEIDSPSRGRKPGDLRWSHRDQSEFRN